MTSERTTMTDEEINHVANELRILLQDRTCCPGHASIVCMTVLAGMALDEAEQDRFKAAATMRRVAKEFAAQIERGVYVRVRPQ